MRNLLQASLLKRLPLLLFSFVFTGAATVFALEPEETGERRLVIRSGLTGMTGYSNLQLTDALRPFFTTSEYYTLDYTPFFKVGALISVRPLFISEHFQLIFDPSFSKFSWGNDREQRRDTIASYVDIDVESLEFPFSLRYSFLSCKRKIQPFIRAGYSFSWFVDTEAHFLSKLYLDDGIVEFLSHRFPFAHYQHAVFISLGTEFHFRWVNYTLEFVCQKGEGIDNYRSEGNFMSASSTTNCYVQLGVMF